MNENKAIGLEQAWKDGKMLDDFSFEEGWEVIHKGITKMKNVLEGLPEPPFSSKDYMMLYTIIYTMCTQKHNLSFGYSEQLYNKYRETHEEYITSKVLPSLREKEGEFMLKELVKRWGNHKVMVKSLCHCFRYLDRFYVLRSSLQPLIEAGITCFRDLVYTEFNGKVMDAVISLIDREREGEQIDQTLLNNVKDIFVEIGMRDMSYYENDFEAPMLKDTAAYYSRKASNPNYVLNVEECLEREKERVSHYLHSNSEPKLLEEVRNVLLSKNSGDAKEEHLSKEIVDLTA